MNGGIWRPLEERARLYPPMLFVCMARYEGLCVHNDKTIASLVSLGVSPMLLRQVSIEPRPVSPGFFHDVGKVLSQSDSNRLFAELHRAQLLWPGSNVFIEDPLFGHSRDELRRTVTSALPHIVPIVDSFKYPNSPLAQLMSLSWGYKETTEEGGEEIIKWFESHR